METLVLAFLIVASFVLLIVIALNSFVVTDINSSKIIYRLLKKTVHFTSPGISFKLPFIDRVVKILNFEDRIYDNDIDATTLDGIEATATVCVVYSLKRELNQDNVRNVLNMSEGKIDDVVESIVTNFITRSIGKHTAKEIRTCKVLRTECLMAELETYLHRYCYQVSRIIIKRISFSENFLNNLRSQTLSDEARDGTKLVERHKVLVKGYLDNLKVLTEITDNPESASRILKDIYFYELLRDIAQDGVTIQFSQSSSVSDIKQLASRLKILQQGSEESPIKQ